MQFAYNRTQKPPKTLRPRHNVIIRWCDLYTRGDLVRPLDHPYNADSYEELQGWGAISHHLAIWDYWISYSYYLFPTPYCMIQCIGPDLKMFADAHTKILFCESEEENEPGENFTAMKYWLGYQLMINPRQPVEPLLEIFINGYYGAAAGPMKAYLEYLQKRIDARAGQRLVRDAPHKLEYLDVEFFVTSQKLFDEAESLVAPGSLAALHVERERSIVDGALLYLWPWLERELPPDSRMPFDHEAVIRRYETNRQAQLEAFYSEEAQALDGPKITKLARVFREATLPEQFQTLPPRDVADFNWLTFSPYWPTYQTFVDDPEAAGETAVLFAADEESYRKPLSFGVTGGPSTALAPDEIPQDGKYHLLKIGRIHLKPGTAVWAYGGDQMGVKVDRLFVPDAQDAAVNDWDAYISLKVKGPAYVKGSTDPNGIWMDRVLLVKPQ